MLGNTLEWVEDCLAPTYVDVPTDGHAYRTDVVLNTTGRLATLNGTHACDYRVLRGGDWGNPPAMIRSAYRNWVPRPERPWHRIAAAASDSESRAICRQVIPG